MTTRRSFLGAMLALAVAPAHAGFAPTSVARAVAPERYVNVLHFGAKGDGITDDAPAIRRAIAKCPPGGVVLIPAGTYSIGPGCIGDGRRVTLRWGTP